MKFNKKVLAIGLVLVIGLTFTGCLSNSTDVVNSGYKVTTEVNNGEGTINLSPEQDTYKEGAEVTVEAAPADGYQFDSWEGSLSGETSKQTITVDSKMTIVANFTNYNNEYFSFTYPTEWTVVEDLSSSGEIHVEVENDTSYLYVDYAATSDSSSDSYSSSVEDFYTQIENKFSNPPDYVTINTSKQTTFNNCPAYKLIYTGEATQDNDLEYNTKFTVMVFYKNNMANYIFYEAKEAEYNSQVAEEILDSFHFN